MQAELLVHKRCPKCTLVPPCAHYDSADKIFDDAPKIMSSNKFKEAVSPTKRLNLLNMVKSQSNHMFGESTPWVQQQDDGYYIDTLQGMTGQGLNDYEPADNTISINRVVHPQNQGSTI